MERMATAPLGTTGCSHARSCPTDRPPPRTTRPPYPPHEFRARIVVTSDRCSVPSVSRTVRLAILGDIHANIVALDAVLASIAEAGITDALITGDTVMRGLEPEECVARVRSTGWPCISGNTDRRVVTTPLTDETDSADRKPGSRRWTRAILSDDALQWLDALPGSVEATLGPYRVVAIHGDQTIPPGLVDDAASDHDIVAIMDALRADVLCVAHTHSPMLRRIGDRLVVNAGSVGEGRLDDHRPSWAWLQSEGNGHISATIERIESPLSPPRAKHHRRGHSRLGRPRSSSDGDQLGTPTDRTGTERHGNHGGGERSSPPPP